MDFNFEVVELIGKLSDENWAKELNIVQWGDNTAKYDIRPWNSDHSKSGKGLTFSISELKTLKEILNNIDI